MKRVCMFLVGLLVCGASFALKPSFIYEAIPDTLKLPFEKNKITTADAVKLQSWTFLPSKDADNKTTLVLAYADAGNMSWWLRQATILSQVGFTVVMFDYRGFGQSDAFSMDPKMLYYSEFASDLAAAVRFARQKYPGNKTGVWAFSMGTIIATLASNIQQPDFVIGDGFVTDPAKIQSFYAKKNDKILLPFDAKDYKSALANVKAPMLIFSGKRDEVTPASEIDQLKKTKPSLEIVDFDGGHLGAFDALSRDYPGSEYVDKIEHFLRLI